MGPRKGNGADSVHLGFLGASRRIRAGSGERPRARPVIKAEPGVGVSATAAEVPDQITQLLNICDFTESVFTAI